MGGTAGELVPYLFGDGFFYAINQEEERTNAGIEWINGKYCRD